MHTEKYLRDRFGTHRPFSVPDHYFDDLTARVLDNVSKQAINTTEKRVEKLASRQTKIINLRPFITAAIIVGVVFGAVIFFNNTFVRQENTNKRSMSIAHNINDGMLSHNNDNDFNATSDYLMIDKDEIYAYLAE